MENSADVANNNREFSPQPSEVLKSFCEWLHGFHNNREKSKAADWALVLLTFLTAVAAFVSAWLFQAQLTEQRRSYRLDERAWVEIEPVKAQNIEGKRFDFSIIPKNIGKTAARNVSFRVAAGSSVEDEADDEKELAFERERFEKELKKELKASKSGNVLVPNSEPPVPLNFRGHARGEKNFYTVVGLFNYVDQFDVPHWKTFCLSATEKPGELEYCTYGNDEDNNPE
jgi:hypothetical protein